jgi:hypothetical protein
MNQNQTTKTRGISRESPARPISRIPDHFHVDLSMDASSKPKKKIRFAQKKKKGERLAGRKNSYCKSWRQEGGGAFIAFSWKSSFASALPYVARCSVESKASSP